MSLSLADIAKESNAIFTGKDFEIRTISTDTRDLPEDCLFIALTGDNFDGHNFISYALENGASYAVSMRPPEKKYQDRTLLVADTRSALMAAAKLHRKPLKTKIIAVTGSVGKTTTKEMIAFVSAAKYNTVKTEKNLNNEIGLSKTILGIEASCEVAVLEMGTDGPGQIVKLSDTALPDIGVITNIGVSHIEAFHTRENILAEKLSVTAGMASGTDLILCGDNDLLNSINNSQYKILKYGIDNKNCSVLADNIREYTNITDFDILFDGSRYNAQIPCPGRHNVLNALAAFCVGLRLEIPPETAISALKKYRPTGMRQNIVEHNSYTVVEDCYNANPDSMRAAFETLGKMETSGRRIAVLSDMLELGSETERYHFEAGVQAARCGLDFILTTGSLARQYVAGAKSAGMGQAEHYGTKNEVFFALKSLLKEGDVVWFKASRGMKLEEIIERIYEL